MKRVTGKLVILILVSSILAACAGARPDISIPKVKPKVRPPRHMPVRVALVLGAGGARGYAHLGAISVLQKAGVPIDVVAGASAGSVIGALFSDDGNIQQATKTLMGASFWDLADIGNFFSFKGIIQGYHLEKFLLKHMRSRDFRQTKIKFIAVATNLKNGDSVKLDSGPIAPAVLASGAIPGAVRPVHLYGDVLVDGWMVDPVPVDAVKPLHPQLIIAINITQQLNHKIPVTAYGIYEKCFNYSWWKLTRLSERGANIIIRPDVGDIGTFDLNDKAKMYRAGVIAAEKALPRIRALMRQRHIKPLKYG